MIWVYDDVTRCWKTGISGNKIVGLLIDQLNRRYSAYIQAKKHIVVDQQIRAFERSNREAWDPDEEKKHKETVYKEARKFLEKNNIFMRLNPDQRKKFLDDMRNYSARYEVQDFNPYGHLLPMKTLHCLNVFTYETEEMKPFHYFTSSINAELLANGHADLFEIEKWFLEIASGNEEKAVYLKRIAAYMCTMLVHDRKLFVLKGTGKNGKGLFKAFICALLDGPPGSDPRWKFMPQAWWTKKMSGMENAEAASPESYMTLNKACLYTDDMDRCPIDANKVKTIVAAEQRSARTLWGNPITIRPTAKVMWTSNYVPDGPGNDNAYW